MMPKAKQSFAILSEQHLKSEKILTVRSKICDFKQRKSDAPTKEIALTVDPKLTEVINKINSIKETVRNNQNPFNEEDKAKAQTVITQLNELEALVESIQKDQTTKVLI